jgi:hypothetical protein
MANEIGFIEGPRLENMLHGRSGTWEQRGNSANIVQKRPTRDSNSEPLAPETSTLTIAPAGLLRVQAVSKYLTLNKSCLPKMSGIIFEMQREQK